jgi:hypothetical protein
MHGFMNVMLEISKVTQSYVKVGLKDGTNWY